VIFVNEQLIAVQEALCAFVINASKETAPVSTVQVLPEAVKALVELSEFLQVQL
jgi:hypothetical protein